MRRRFALPLAFAFVVAACTGTTSPPSTPAPPSTSTTLGGETSPTSEPPAQTSTLPPTLATVGCDVAPDQFQLLCEVHGLIVTNYVDPVSEEDLARAATEAVAAADLSPDTEGRPLTCALPAPEFVGLCEEIDGVADTAAAVETAVAGMVAGALDPFSAYLDPTSLELEREEQSGTVEGIGALVVAEDRSAPDPRLAPCGVMSDTCRLVIVATLDGSPARAAGLLPDDEIVGVDGEPIEGWTFEEVTRRVRGPAGTPVTLTIGRNGATFDVTITRAAIDIPVEDHEVVDGHIGYLRLRVFTDNSDELVHDALGELLDQGIDLLVFDLRGDPGGALDSAVNIASEFLADGLVLRTVSPEGTVPYEVRPGGLATDPDLPVVITVDRGSASASEVVSGALQEAGRAVIVGTPTFGKNTVQRRFGLSNGGALKLTIARWETPGGHDFGGVGIIPDVEVDLPADLSAAELVDRAVEAARQVGLIG